MQKYLTILYVALVALVLNCTSGVPKPCSAAQLAAIDSECLALERVGCPVNDAGTGDRGQGGAVSSDDAVCKEIKDSCAARVDAYEACQ